MMALFPDAALYSGEVMHRRYAPAVHAFRHGLFFIRLRINGPGPALPRLFSRNRWNLVSVRDADYGPRDGSALEPWIRSVLARHGLHEADGPIWLQTFPRVLGYAFNPVSFWLCHDRDGGLRAVLAEVNNTFGEHHNYLVAHADGRPIRGGDWLSARKVFHVSPFFPVSGDYRFRFEDDAAGCRFRIDYDDGAGNRLVTQIRGTAAPLSTAVLARELLRRPWLTAGVILRIHYHALRLWLKRVPFFSKPLPPAEDITR
ncbi:MAG: DUF1365 domain-containing protein [Betaproteobacteria bacterium]|jgi:DUF1365 family protein